MKKKSDKEVKIKVVAMFIMYSISWFIGWFIQ